MKLGFKTLAIIKGLQLIVIWQAVYASWQKRETTWPVWPYHVFWVNKRVIDSQEVQSILDTDAAYDPTNSTKPASYFNWCKQYYRWFSCSVRQLMLCYTKI